MYEKLFSELKVNELLTLRNRVVAEPHQVGLCAAGEFGGVTTPESLAFYRRRAEGGVGLIVTELACVEPTTGLQSLKSIRATEDYAVEEFAKIADAIHAGGAAGMVQINHPGSEVHPLLVKPENLVSASALPSHRFVGKKTRELTADEIAWLADCYGRSARNIQLSGLDGVAVHGAHQYLIHQFLSPNMNKRSDEFGGTVENRARFLKMVLESIRGYCGPDFPIMLRLSAEEYIGKNGQHFDEVFKVAKWAEAWGATILDISASGGMAHGSQSVEPPSFDQGWRKHFAKAVKANVSVPVSTVAIIRDPAYAEWMLENNYCDLVGSARNFIADPDWANKAKAGSAMRPSPPIPARSAARSTPRRAMRPSPACPRSTATGARSASSAAAPAV